MLKLVLLAAMALQAPPRTEFAWDCELRSATRCSPEGCADATPNYRIRLDPNYSEYWRCVGNDPGRCNQYQAAVSVDGSHLLFELPRGAAFAKVGPDLSVVDVMAGGDLVLVSRGTCMVGPPAIRRTPG